MIPGTEYVLTPPFSISGNDPKFIYNLLNLYNFIAQPIDIDGKAAMFTNTSNENAS